MSVSAKKDIEELHVPAQSVQQNSAAANNGFADWSDYRKIAFRIAFVFFLIMCIPGTPGWYKHLVSIDWTNIHYRDLYDICRFSNFQFVKMGPEARWGIGGYSNWGVTLLVAIAVGAIWSLLDRKSNNYEKLNYWLRVIVRYRAALGIIGFGFTKLLPVQMPYPSLGLLNTDLGDFSGQKIFWLSIGIVPWFQIYTGIVEVLAGVLLLFRKTTAWGAALLLGTLGTIAVVNIGYDGGVHVYASYFVLLSAFLLVYDVKKIYELLVLERVVRPVQRYYPAFKEKWQEYARRGIKAGLIAVFVVWFFYLQLLNFLYDPYKQPSAKGVTALRGNYQVTLFKLNNEEIPYSPLDTVRWQEVTFEKWSTLTYKVNKPVQLDLSNGGGDPMRDINRTFEVSGVGGGRRVFYYEADTIGNVLYLQDKNLATVAAEVGPGGIWDRRGRNQAEEKDPVYPENWIPSEALANIGDPVYKINARVVNTRRIRAFESEKPVKARRKMVLKYDTSDGSRIVLTGTDENRDSLYVVLDRIDRPYVLSESTLEAGSY